VPTPDFIIELRRMIGHHPLWLPGVTAFVQDGEGRILFGRRADSGLWALPSGIPEPSEEMADTCAREVLEETGIVVEVERLIAIQTVGPMTYPNGDVTSFVDHFFGCRALSGTAHVADEESLDVGWFARDDVPRPTTARTPSLLDLADSGTERAWFRSGRG
jgi:8-oxo-dGTP pyrophosphatase MutT (NUDIX family)